MHGIGPKTAEKFYAQGIRTIDDLRTKAKLTPQQQVYLQFYDELRSPIPRGEVAVMEKIIQATVHQIDPQLQVVICGSYRRGKATCGDVDCLITHPDPNWSYSSPAGSSATASSRPSASSSSRTPSSFLLDDILHRLRRIDLLTHDLSLSNHFHKAGKNIYESQFSNETYSGIGRIAQDDTCEWGGRHRRIDIKIYHVSEFPFAVLYFTGSKEFNRAMRLYANRKFSLTLSDKALSPYQKRGREKVASGVPIPCENEAAIFAAINVKYIPPTERDKIPPVFLEK